MSYTFQAKGCVVNLRQTMILSALFATLFATGGAHAQGNVLLPNENLDKSTLPNLGLIPAETTPPPEQPKLPEPVKEETTPPKQTATQPAKQQTTQPTNPGATQIQGKTNYVAIPMSGPPPVPRMPYTINVSMSPQTKWTPADIDNVSGQTGLPKPEVMTNCRLGFNGMLITDQGSSQVESSVSNTATVSYGGAVSNALLSVYAACLTAPKPAQYSYLQHMGNYYIVALNSAFCQPKVPFSGTMRQIVITHVASGSDTCTFMP